MNRGGCYEILSACFEVSVKKKAKTFLLFFVLVLVNTMILSTSMILRATNESMDSMQAKTNSKVVAEITDTENMITDAEVNLIENMKNITAVNRVGQYDIFPSNFMPITGNTSSGEDNSKVVLLSYDDLEKDSPFSDLQYKLTAGDYIQQDKKVRLSIPVWLIKTDWKLETP
ncbi:hypothetical protein SD457_23065 [Coprobacillaceae bacterium CR2/5/TPMF4]|nr:hypothetical protein SD457_23065 [Coprobacillaceae bacterium CR2/5/TPMF4]